jgi:hypothetical protein
MTPEPDNQLRLEIGHVLFIDIVGYSKLLIEEQKDRLRQLTKIVLATPQVAKSTDERLVRLPTGDGMALVAPMASDMLSYGGPKLLPFGTRSAAIRASSKSFNHSLLNDR